MSLTQKFALLAVLSVTTSVFGDTIVHSDSSVLLSSLLGGDTVMVGDKTFGDFTYSPVGDMPPASAVNVIPIVTDGDFGIRFQGGFIDLVDSGSQIASDSLITFSVSAPEPWISGAVLSGNLEASSGIASITETFLPDLTTTTLTITSGFNLVDSTVFDTPVQTLQVQKDILLRAVDAPATLSFVDQTFPQVPEPNAGLIALFGVMGLFFGRRRR